jgi:hypothetical protein
MSSNEPNDIELRVDLQPRNDVRARVVARLQLLELAQRQRRHGLFARLLDDHALERRHHLRKFGLLHELVARRLVNVVLRRVHVVDAAIVSIKCVRGKQLLECTRHARARRIVVGNGRRQALSNVRGRGHKHQRLHGRLAAAVPRCAAQTPTATVGSNEIKHDKWHMWPGCEDAVRELAAHGRAIARVKERVVIFNGRLSHKLFDLDNTSHRTIDETGTVHVAEIRVRAALVNVRKQPRRCQGKQSVSHCRSSLTTTTNQMSGILGEDYGYGASESSDDDMPPLTNATKPKPSRHVAVYLAFDAFLQPFLNDTLETIPSVSPNALDAIFEAMASAECKELRYFSDWRAAIFISDLAVVYMELRQALPAVMALVAAINVKNKDAILWTKQSATDLVTMAAANGCLASFDLLVRTFEQECFSSNAAKIFTASPHACIVRAYIAHPARTLILYKYISSRYIGHDAALAEMLRDPKLETAELYRRVHMNAMLVPLLCEIVARGPIPGKDFMYSSRESTASILCNHAKTGDCSLFPLPRLLEGLLFAQQNAYFTTRSPSQQHMALVVAALECANPQTIGRVLSAKDYLELLTVLVVKGNVQFYARYAQDEPPASRGILVRFFEPCTLFRERMIAHDWTIEEAASVAKYLIDHAAPTIRNEK